MNIKVRETITIYSPTAEIVRMIKKRLTIPNPEYVSKVRNGFWVGNTPKTIALFSEDGDSITIPYGCLYWILDYTDFSGVEWYQPRCGQVEYNRSDVPLYDYQQDAVKKMSGLFCGILEAPAGSGKTQMGIALALQSKLPTLWLAHTLDLVKQSYDRACIYTDKDKLAVTTGGKLSVGEGITFATVQTMANVDLSALRNRFGMIIVDECHHVAGSPTRLTAYYKVLNSLNAQVKLGLSATVHRSDGSIVATKAMLGDISASVDRSAVSDRIVDVTVTVVPTDKGLSDRQLNSDGTLNYSAFITDIVEDENRNSIIANKILEGKMHSNLILSDRLNHLESLMYALPESERKYARMISGKCASKSKRKEREMCIQDMRDGKAKYLFATYALAKEGLDIPRLDRLYLTTPKTDKAVITQSIGRIARAFEGKPAPIAYDFVDDIPYAKTAFSKRFRIYKRIGCKF